MTRPRLESLRLVGFKSFPDEVELGFPGDVCAIIGPNGCGKSNLVDAMLWTLGEQSPSLLRLKQMGDVVFTGAAGRSPAGAAEVTLRLRSDDGRWSETEGRLEISRRVYRSGPSEYRVNGRITRLKDIVDELLAVGLGTRNYAIIEQGRVGQVLSARPVDRRVLLEEAAGITRYKNRRHEAELKLEHTRQNLLRLDDVIAEVDRSLRQLKRQARQADRYRKIEEEIRDRLISLYALQAGRLDAQRQELIKHHAVVQNEVAAAAAALAGAEVDLAEARQASDRVRAELENARAETAQLLGSRERLEAFLERSADLLDNLRGSLDKARKDGVVLDADRSRLEAEVGSSRTRVESLESALRDAHTRVEDATAHEIGARQLAEAEAARAGSLRQDLLRTISTLTDSRNRLGDMERQQDRLAYTVRQLGHELERLQARRGELASGYEQACTTSRSATAAAERLEDQRRDLAAGRNRRQEESNAAKHEAETHAHATWEYRHRLAGIERELSRHAAVLDQIASGVPEEAIIGQVSDFLHPESGAAVLLDRVWAEWLELPVVRREQLGAAEMERLSGLDGRIRLVLSENAPPLPTRPTIDGAEELLARAGVCEKDLSWLARTLPPAYLCDDPSAARRLADTHPEARFLDRDGTLRRGRTVELASTEAPRHGTLALREERSDLVRQIETSEERADTSSDRHQQLLADIERLDHDLLHVRETLVGAEQERARAAAVEHSLGDELSRLQRELESLDADAERNRRQEEEIQQRRDKLEGEVASLESRSLELEQAVEDATSALDARREEAAEALRRLDRWRAEARLAEERVTAATTESQRLKAEQKSVADRLEALRTEAERLARELAATEDEVVRSRTRLSEEHGLLKAARVRERQLADTVAGSDDRVTGLDKEVRSRREEHDRLRDVLHAAEVDMTRADAEWRRLRETALSELAMTPEALLKVEAVEDQTEDALQTTVATLRQRLDKIGPVNLLALKEVEELAGRSQFLHAQRKDLVESLRQLDGTIRDIDSVCTDRFVATFEAVNGVFAKTFSQLFGGGTARLDLVDEDDPLESGIDITAQPPGKRNQSVQLLSGGEKALTALSLLISLFRIRPSPFCILDEVDAPLDDANVERLADLVHDMAEHTQFVMITHNRRTMARADILYGVTMEEAGVSKVVSVRLEG